MVMTSNAEREFPPPFLRRCVRLSIDPPTPVELTKIVRSHFDKYKSVLNSKRINKLIADFDGLRKENKEVATDQLLNAIFLIIAMKESGERSFSKKELAALKDNLLKQLSGP
jgi:MoxR-like ATPase